VDRGGVPWARVFTSTALARSKFKVGAFKIKLKKVKRILLPYMNENALFLKLVLTKTEYCFSQF